MKSLWIAPLVLAAACSSQPVRRTYSNGDAVPTQFSSKSKQNTAVTIPESNGKTEGLREAHTLYSQADYERTISHLNLVNEKKLSRAEQTDYWNLKGLAQLALQKQDSAESSFRKSITANPNPEFAGYYQYNLATALTNQGKTAEATDVIAKINLKSLEVPDQKKTLALKERIAQIESGAISPMPTPVPVSTPAPVKEVYSGPVNENRIGLLLPLSGKYEAFGKKAQRAIELAFQNSPLPHAKEVELVAMDTGDTPASQQEALKKLVEEQQVIAVIGPLLSKGINTLTERAEYYQVPLISIAQVQGSVSPFLFSCSVSTQDQATKMADYAMKVRGLRKFAILAPSNKVGIEMANRFWDEVQARDGEIKAFELYDPEVTDFRAPVDKVLGLHYLELRSKELKELAEKREELKITKKTMKTAQYFSLPPIIDFDAVFIADEAKTVGQIIPTFTYRDAKNLNFLGITSWNSTQLLSRTQDQSEGAVFPVAFNTLSPPAETKAFYDLYSTTYSSYPGELDAIAYDAASVAIKAISDRPSNRTAFAQKIESLTEIAAATGSLSIKDHRCSRNLTLYEIKKGQFEAISETPSTTGTH